MNAKLDHALVLIAMGFSVFPIRAGCKSPPAITGWQAAATRDEAQINTWWGNGAGADRNIGIFTGKFGDGEALLVLDVDRKKGVDGNKTILRWELDGRTLPDTYVQHTPSTGSHLVYRVTTPVKGSAGVLGAGVDVRSAGGYVVAKGSVVPLGTYEADIRPVADAPQWLIDLCGRPSKRGRPPKTSRAVPIDQDRAAARAIEYLKTKAPVAVERKGGDEETYKVAAAVKDYGVDKDSAARLMLEHWNPRCQPEWERQELEEKVRNAYLYGEREPGWMAPEVDFAEPYTPSPGEQIDEPKGTPLEEINKEYALITFGGGSSVIWNTTDAQEGKDTRLIDLRTFHLRNADIKMMDGE
jgi:hypothetical protein